MEYELSGMPKITAWIHLVGAGPGFENGESSSCPMRVLAGCPSLPVADGSVTAPTRVDIGLGVMCGVGAFQHALDHCLAPPGRGWARA